MRDCESFLDGRPTQYVVSSDILSDCFSAVLFSLFLSQHSIRLCVRWAAAPAASSGLSTTSAFFPFSPRHPLQNSELTAESLLRIRLFPFSIYSTSARSVPVLSPVFGLNLAF